MFVAEERRDKVRQQFGDIRGVHVSFVVEVSPPVPACTFEPNRHPSYPPQL